MKKTGFHLLLALMVVSEIVTLIWQFHMRANLLAKNQALELPPDRISALLAENRRLTQAASAVTGSTLPTNREADELNHLRSQVQDQQHQLQDLQAQLAVQTALPAFQSLSGSNRFVNLPRDSWTRAGYSTPEAALESMLWATLHGDVDKIRASLTPAELKRRNDGPWKGRTDEEIADAGVQGLSQVSGLQILNLQMMSATEAHFTVYISGLEQPDQPLWMDMNLINGEWKSNAAEHRVGGY